MKDLTIEHTVRISLRLGNRAGYPFWKDREDLWPFLDHMQALTVGVLFGGAKIDLSDFELTESDFSCSNLVAASDKSMFDRNNYIDPIGHLTSFIKWSVKLGEPDHILEHIRCWDREIEEVRQRSSANAVFCVDFSSTVDLNLENSGQSEAFENLDGLVFNYLTKG